MADDDATAAPEAEAKDDSMTGAEAAEGAVATPEASTDIDPADRLALQLKHRDFAGDWSQLLRLDEMMNQRRYHHNLRVVWNEWRQSHDGPLDLKSLSGHRANLRDTDLHGADLQGARLTEALLNRCNLAGADLRGAALRGADMEACDLTDADLRGADLRWARRTTLEQLSAAKGDAHTQLPIEAERPSNWQS